MGACYARRTNHVIRRLGSGDWGKSCGQWFSQSCLCNETSIKTLDTKAPASFLLCLLTIVCSSLCVLLHIDVPGRWCILTPQEEDTEAACLGPSQSHPMCFFFWLILICIFFFSYNKTIIVSIVFSWVLWVTVANYWT